MRSFNLFMPDIRKNVSLANKNTLALKASADFYCKVSDEAELLAAVQWAEEQSQPLWVLGGGSNVVFPSRFKGLVLHMGLTGINRLKETSTTTTVRAQAGENWDEFLQQCIQYGWHGLDNLAIIPGTVGAAPVQNIGAYGQEVAECILQVQGLDLEDQQMKTLSRQDCQFSYRDSIFKHALKQRFIITAVDFSFQKKAIPNTRYAPLNHAFSDTPPTFQQIRALIIKTRHQKLPSPCELPNCGSFFKNPVVSVEKLNRLKESYPDIPHFAYDKKIKLAAGWLIETAGFKGFVQGSVGTYEKHALVVVNHGGAAFDDVMQLKSAIQQGVEARFGVMLEQEPLNVY